MAESLATPTTGTQFGRVANLIVANAKGGRDLTGLHFRFYVRQCDTDIPNSMVVRIYNLSRDTEREITLQYTQISLQVGYVGTTVEMLFSGDIKYFKRGKENSTDRFLEITAGDNDLGWNYGFLQVTLGPGSTPGQVMQAVAKSMGKVLDTTALSTSDLRLGGAYPRGKVFNSLGRIYMDQVAATAGAAGAKWFVENGVLKFFSTTGYLPGNAVVLSPATGLIGIPEATDQGIEGRCLLNAALKIGCSLQIDEDTIVQTFSPPSVVAQLNSINDPGHPNDHLNLINPIAPPQITQGITTVAKPTPGKGIYRIALLECSGDNRGEEWYSDFTALTITPSAPAGQQVAVNGGVAKGTMP
jgi:hypothetical protein